MKTITIDLDQFRDQLDQSLAAAEEGDVIVTRLGKPWIIVRAAPRAQNNESPAETNRRSETVRCIHGPTQDDLPVASKTVSTVRQLYSDLLNISPKASAFVDGNEVSEDFILENGQVLEFLDKYGVKSRTAMSPETLEFWEMIKQRRAEPGIPWDEAKRELDLD